ncbi:MAG: hypothetical protein F8N36_16000 [Desulfovibrio sp.]|nr:hypothetical protein [Desulfovibrio sp.]
MIGKAVGGKMMLGVEQFGRAEAQRRHHPLAVCPYRLLAGLEDTEAALLLMHLGQDLAPLVRGAG